MWSGYSWNPNGNLFLKIDFIETFFLNFKNELR